MTLGSVILAAHGPATAWSQLDPGSFAELHGVIGDLEQALGTAFRYDRLNYLMLMMVDPNVHFHVIPRYAGERRFGDLTFVDAGWPGPPDLSRSNETGEDVNGVIMAHLKSCWPET